MKSARASFPTRFLPSSRRSSRFAAFEKGDTPKRASSTRGRAWLRKAMYSSPTYRSAREGTPSERAAASLARSGATPWDRSRAATLSRSSVPTRTNMHRERMVGSTACSFPVRINSASSGGSSRVLRRAFWVWGVSLWASGINKHRRPWPKTCRFSSSQQARTVLMA